jgi:hypothetical protein
MLLKQVGPVPPPHKCRVGGTVILGHPFGSSDSRSAGRDRLSMGFGTNPRQGGIDPLRTELAHRLVLARTVEEIDDLLEEAECWLRKRPYDEDVRVASEAATERRVRLLADAQKREGG